MIGATKAKPVKDEILYDLGPSFAHELRRIAKWWGTTAVDPAEGFHGQISLELSPVAGALRSVVATSRICWFFSRLATLSGDPGDRLLTDRAANYLTEHFLDRSNGGFFWEVDEKGAAIDKRKHAYGQAFALYAFAARYELTGDIRDLELARSTFELIERHFRDPADGGYGEARSADWSVIEDQRLSAKDDIAPRSMNTHLHILEAYAELYRVAPDQRVAQALRGLIEIHLRQIYDQARGHLKLFWGERGNDLSRVVSYGHDIEASWLVWNATLLLDDSALRQRAQSVVLALAENCLTRGCGPHGEMFNEKHLGTGEVDKARIWWVQAEALVGFLNAFEVSGELRFAEQARAQWSFIKNYIIDEDAGEWRWVSTLDPLPEEAYWAGPWKTCYHNGRAMMEAVTRLRAAGWGK